MSTERVSGSAGRLSLAVGAAFLTLTLGTGAAIAAGPTDQTTAAESGQIENIIITARRVEESQQSVPITVTALSAQDLEQGAVLSVQDLQSVTPGLFVGYSSTGGEPTFAIRGAKADSGTSPTVAVYLDDVPMKSTEAIANMVYDMQSITTLKGPQGTLFGANSTGGAIVFRPNKPTDTLEGYAQAGYGNYDRKEFQGMVNVPVNSVLQVRLAGEFVRQDKGFETNLTPAPYPDRDTINNDKHESARLSVRLKLSDTLLNDTVVDYYHVDDQPVIPWVGALRPAWNYATFLGITLPVNYAAAGVSVLPPFQTATSQDATSNIDRFYGVANTTSWDVNPNWTLKNVIGFRKDSVDSIVNQTGLGPGLSTSDGLAGYRNTQWTLEPSSTVTWDDGRWTNKTGIYLSHIESLQLLSYKVIGLAFDYSGQPAFVQPTVQSFYPLIANQLHDTVFKSEAVYDQLSVKLSKELTLTAGARYTWDQGTYAADERLVFPSNPGGLAAGFLNPSAGPCAGSSAGYENYNPATCTGHRSLDSSAPSFILSLEDQFAERRMVYASLSGGYIEGGFNGGVASKPAQVFGPEKVTEFEGGLKADWDAAGRPLRTNVAVFYGTYNGQQRLHNGIDASGVTYQAVQNAGSTLFYGTDIELNYAVTSYLDLAATYEHLIAYYTNFDSALSVPGITSAIDQTGQQEAQAPKDVVTASATLKWPLPREMGALSTTLSFFYRSQTFSKDSPTIGGQCAGNTPATPVTTCNAPGTFVPDPTQNFTAYDTMPAYGLYNLTTQWKGIAGTHLDAELWVKNLTNKLYFNYNNNQMLTYGYAAFYLGDPRTYGARLRYSF